MLTGSVAGCLLCEEYEEEEDEGDECTCMVLKSLHGGMVSCSVLEAVADAEMLAGMGVEDGARGRRLFLLLFVDLVL